MREEEQQQQQKLEQPDPADQSTLVFDSEEEPFNTAFDTTSDGSAITMGKPVTTAFFSDQVQIPTEKHQNSTSSIRCGDIYRVEKRVHSNNTRN